MERFYALVKTQARRALRPPGRGHGSRSSGGGFTASTSATAQSSTEQALIDALTKLYAYAYGVPRGVGAARRRSSGRWRCDSQIAGCARAAIWTSSLIADERAALVRSYAALLAAVHLP